MNIVNIIRLQTYTCVKIANIIDDIMTPLKLPKLPAHGPSIRCAYHHVKLLLVCTI